MGYPPLEKMLPKANGSIYTLVRIAAKRALELSEGQPNLIGAPISQKLATTALEEIVASRVVSKDGAENFKPAKKA